MHPLFAHHLTRLRQQETLSEEFRLLVRRLSFLLAVETTRDLTLVERDINTPIAQASGMFLKERVGLFPIMRAGLGMLDAFLDLLPTATVHHLGLYRESTTLLPVEYYTKLPRHCSLDVGYVIDPMIATAGTAIAAVNILKDWGLQRIVFVSILASQEGVDALKEAHPDITVVIGCIDEAPLTSKGYIMPGLGDAGDRYYNTK